MAYFSTAMDLPFEIWLHIASFLPTDQLQRMHTLSRMFYGIAMTEKYKVIDFSKDMKTIPGTLASLNHSSNAQRVRTLHLYPDVLADYISRKPGSKTSTGTPSRVYKYIGVPISRHDRWSKKVMAQMLQVVGGMFEVTDFRIITQGHSPRSQFRKQIVNAGWAAFGSTLCSLTLVARLGECNFSLEPTLVFPTLEHLAIDLSCEFVDRVDGTKLVCDSLVPFVNNHHSTLRSLALYLETDSHSNVFSWFSCIRHLPHLAKFTFRYGFLDTDPDTSVLRHILKTHSAELRELELILSRNFPVNADKWYTQPSLRVALPRLESLYITLDCFSDPFRTALYLRQFKNSLTTLKLTNRRLPYNEVEMIVNEFEGRNWLRMLHMEVDHLGPALFDLLSAKLPGLDGLHLVFLWITAEFVETMGRQSYPEWTLRHFTARPLLCVDPALLADWQAVIGAVLPHLQTLSVAH